MNKALIHKIRDIVLATNKAGTPMHSRLLLQELAKDENTAPMTARTLCHYLHHMGFYYGKGNHRNILHDSQKVIDYRKIYVECHLNNLNAKGLPKLPEVFLDEL